jgi:type IV pilus assembly protein PilQ
LIDPAAGGRIQVDARSNALVITERPSRMNKIQEIIDSLDRVTDQVMIESKFIEVRNNNDEDIGIDWAYINDTPGNLLPEDGAISGNPGPLTASTGGLVAVFSRNEFAATLTALQQQDRSNLVSNPTVVVMNNQKAVFQVGEDYPIREFSVNDQTGQLETGELEYRFTGIELDVTPTVNAAGMITLDVHPVVSEPGETVDTVINGGLLQDRIFLKRDAKTQVTIKDGYTIALGGLSRQKTQVIEGKIPFFGDLPFVGRLFSHNIAEEDNSNLIIFLTAKTLNPDGSTYADVIDPRQLEAMKLTPDQLPGYQVPQHELDMINAVEAKRMEDAAAKFKMKMDASLLEKEESFPEQTWTPVEWERGY